MKYIKLETTDPKINLATEQWLFENINEDLIILWQNKECVVLGTNQDAQTQLNMDYIRENNIDVVRRVSGGGCVFHNLDNVNFTYITNDISKISNYDIFMNDIVICMQNMGIDAIIKGKNDIVVNDYKVSGNAQYTNGKKLLHHGTLLYNVDLNAIVNALKVNRKKLTTKGIDSNKSRVGSISEYIDEDLGISWFINSLEGELFNLHRNLEKLSNEMLDYEKIQEISNNKFGNDNWTYKCVKLFENIKEDYIIDVGHIKISYDVRDGIIKDINITGDFLFNKHITEFEQSLVNEEFTYTNLENVLMDLNIQEYIKNLTNENFLRLLFT